jgi:hypothetical protein
MGRFLFPGLKKRPLAMEAIGAEALKYFVPVLTGVRFCAESPASVISVSGSCRYLLVFGAMTIFA